ncbi:hypothetical protein ALC53_00657, partial [Atta colombica]
RMQDERERGRKLKRARNRVKRTRTSKGEKTARGRETTGAQATSSHSCRQGSVTTAQFVHSACGTVWGGSNERSLLGRAPTDESRRTDGDLHPLCFCAPFRSGRLGTVCRSVSTPLSGIAVLDDREYDGREIGRMLFVSFQSGGEDMEWKETRSKERKRQEENSGHLKIDRNFFMIGSRYQAGCFKYRRSKRNVASPWCEEKVRRVRGSSCKFGNKVVHMPITRSFLYLF